jgi:broad specificity phosphatase PhoE/SAM-dependent methyltransferase
MKLFLIRHARPLRSGVCYGQTDVPCEPLPNQFLWADTRPQRVVASDLGRCRELAVQIAAAWECPLEFEPRLREMDFGEWENRSWDALGREDGARLDRWMANYLVEPPPGGESYRVLADRVGRVLAKAEAAGDDVAWVTHAGPIRVVLAQLLGLSPEATFRFEPPYLGCSVLQQSATGWSLAAWGLPLVHAQQAAQRASDVGKNVEGHTELMVAPQSGSGAAAAANAVAWDRLARERAALARPAVDEAFGNPRGWLGEGGPQGRRWLPERLDGLEVLCLAAGGGKHGPLYAAAGAKVTVLDISSAMLDLDRQVARERKIDFAIVQGSMDDLSMLGRSRFDLVIHPVSTCYVPDVGRVFREVARVTKPGGLYVSQHKAPASLQATLGPTAAGRYELLHPQTVDGPLPPAPPSRLRESGTHEFVHSLTALLGGICAVGFVIEDVGEPDHTRPAATAGSFAHRAAYLPPYLRVLARRQQDAATTAGVVVVG